MGRLVDILLVLGECASGLVVLGVVFNLLTGAHHEF